MTPWGGESPLGYFLRRCDSLPTCFEAHKEVDITPVLSYFQANCNKATGLPFPLDLVDQDVSLPQGFTKEFVEEVEAVLIQEPRMRVTRPIILFRVVQP